MKLCLAVRTSHLRTHGRLAIPTLPLRSHGSNGRLAIPTLPLRSNGRLQLGFAAAPGLDLHGAKKTCRKTVEAVQRKVNWKTFLKIKR